MVKHERQNGSGPKAICTSFNRKTRIWPNGVRRHVRYFRYGRPASLSLFVCASIFFKRNIPHKKDKGNHPLMHACQDHTKICFLFFLSFHRDHDLWCVSSIPFFILLSMTKLLYFLKLHFEDLAAFTVWISCHSDFMSKLYCLPYIQIFF